MLNKLLYPAIQSMSNAPKAKYSESGERIFTGLPKILLFFENDAASVGYWDWYYAEGGRGYDGGSAWIEPVSGERLDSHYGEPIGWLSIFEK